MYISTTMHGVKKISMKGKWVIIESKEHKFKWKIDSACIFDLLKDGMNPNSRLRYIKRRALQLQGLSLSTALKSMGYDYPSVKIK